MFYNPPQSPRSRRRSEVIQSARFRILGEQNPRLEHRHGDRWIRMDRTIPMLTDRQPRSYRGTGELLRSLALLRPATKLGREERR
jgi:hypothetical protein